MHITVAMDFPGIKENTLGSRRFTGINMCNNAYVAYFR
jgi:hypothetical protein